MRDDHRAPQEAIENVAEDSDLGPGEKETSINFGKRHEHARLFTSESGLMRRVLAHPDVSIVALVVEDGDSRPALDLEDYGGQTVVGVRATAPIGLLKIGLKPRKDNQHARIVSDRVMNTREATQ